MPDNNCCVFQSKFCTTEGLTVIGKMKIKNGVFSVSYYNLDGTPHTENDIVLNTCQNAPVANSSPFTLSLSILECRLNTEYLSVNLDFGGVAGIVGVKNGTKILLNITHDLDFFPGGFLGLTPSGGFAIEQTLNSNFDVLITNVSLLSNSISFIIPFNNGGCNTANTYYGEIEAVQNMELGYQANPLVGDSVSNT